MLKLLFCVILNDDIAMNLALSSKTLLLNWEVGGQIELIGSSLLGLKIIVDDFAPISYKFMFSEVIGSLCTITV